MANQDLKKLKTKTNKKVHYLHLSQIKALDIYRFCTTYIWVRVQLYPLKIKKGVKYDEWQAKYKSSADTACVGK